MSWTRLTAGTMIPHELSIFQHRQRELHRNLSKFRLRSGFCCIGSLDSIAADRTRLQTLPSHWSPIGSTWPGGKKGHIWWRRRTNTKETKQTTKKQRKPQTLDEKRKGTGDLTNHQHEHKLTTRSRNLRDALKVRDALSYATVCVCLPFRFWNDLCQLVVNCMEGFKIVRILETRIWQSEMHALHACGRIWVSHLQ